jgi:hypothetical protein
MALVSATLELVFDGALAGLSARHVALVALAVLAVLAALCALSHLRHLGRCVTAYRASRLDIGRLDVV